MTNQNKIHLCYGVFIGHIILTYSLTFTRICHFFVHSYLLLYVQGVDNSSLIGFLILIRIIFLSRSMIDSVPLLCGVMDWSTQCMIIWHVISNFGCCYDGRPINYFHDVLKGHQVIAGNQSCPSNRGNQECNVNVSKSRPCFLLTRGFDWFLMSMLL